MVGFSGVAAGFPLTLRQVSELFKGAPPLTCYKIPFLWLPH
jgi:hypothetical protein